MNILLLSSAFNGLSQRAYGELLRAGHTVHVRLAINEDVIRADVAELRPDLILCPFLKDRVPADVYTQTPTLIVHPGRPGDRGPSSLDWTIHNNLSEWGVTVLEAGEIMDGGDIWAHALYERHDTRKGALYNGQSADAAMHAMHEAVRRYPDWKAGTWTPRVLNEQDPDILGREQPLMRMPERQITWGMSSADIIRRIHAADGVPGAPAHLSVHGRDLGEFLLFDVHAEDELKGSGQPGEIIGQRDDAVLIQTADRPIWIGHLRPRRKGAIKLPATTLLRGELGGVPTYDLHPWSEPWADTYQPIRVRRHGALLRVTWTLYNGAMSTAQLQRLRAAVGHALNEQPAVLLLDSGTQESFSNGIHLNVIDAAPGEQGPAHEAWANINAINDVIQDVLEAPGDVLVISGVAANAGAGGVILGLAADVVVARQGVVLNPHYRSMGLYGSEFWTRLLPARVGPDLTAHYTQRCVPVTADQALSDGLVDHVLPRDPRAWHQGLRDLADRLISGPERTALLALKRQRRQAADATRSLHEHRQDELSQMHLDMYDDASGFAAARHAFVHKTKTTQTPAHVTDLPRTLADWPARTAVTPDTELALA